MADSSIRILRPGAPPEPPPPGLDRPHRDTADVLWKAFGITIAFLMLWLLGDVILLVFGAALLAVVLRGVAEALAKRTGGSANTSLGFVSIGVVLAVLAIGALSGPQLAEQGDQLWDQVIKVGGQGRAWLEQYSWGRTFLQRVVSMQGAPDGQEIAQFVGALMNHIVGVLAGFVIVVAAALYFAAAPSVYTKGVVRLLRPERRERGRQVLTEAGIAMRRWMKGQSLSMLVLAVAAYAGLTVIGIPLAPLLAILAGLANFVPYVGPFVGACPSILVAFGVSPEKALYVAGMFTVVQMIEGNVIAPMIQKRVTHLPPAASILSQTLLGALFGIPGVILATPILAASLVLVRRLYIEDVLGDHEHEEEPSHTTGTRLPAPKPVP